MMVGQSFVRTGPQYVANYTIVLVHKKPLCVPNVTCEGLTVTVDQGMLIAHGNRRLDSFSYYLLTNPVSTMSRMHLIYFEVILVIFNNIT